MRFTSRGRTLATLLTILSVLLTGGATASAQLHVDTAFDDQLDAEWQLGFWDCAGNLMASCSSLSESEVVHNGSASVRAEHCCPATPRPGQRPCLEDREAGSVDDLSPGIRFSGG